MDSTAAAGSQRFRHTSLSPLLTTIAEPVPTLSPPMPEPEPEQPVPPEKKTGDGQHDTQEQVRYVEVSSPGGWQTMAKTVREVDEDKVKDCKEDIDTLLVFVSRCSCFML